MVERAPFEYLPLPIWKLWKKKVLGMIGFGWGEGLNHKGWLEVRSRKYGSQDLKTWDFAFAKKLQALKESIREDFSKFP